MKRSYEDLEVWQRAISLAERIYNVTKPYPNDEKYGITSHMRRCAVSIASNIAEGAAGNINGEFIQFIGIAKGSAAEL